MCPISNAVFHHSEQFFSFTFHFMKAIVPDGRHRLNGKINALIVVMLCLVLAGCHGTKDDGTPSYTSSDVHGDTETPSDRSSGQGDIPDTVSSDSHSDSYTDSLENTDSREISDTDVDTDTDMIASTDINVDSASVNADSESETGFTDTEDQVPPPICTPESCHEHASCDDSGARVVCSCKDGFYGDGRICVMEDSFWRVAAGSHHTCAVTGKGTPVCFGDDLSNQSSPPDVVLRQISAGQYHTCGITAEDALVCWGYNGDERSTPPEGEFQQVSAGMAHTCAVRKDGTVICFGSDVSGQSTAPDGRFFKVAAGEQHTCGIREDGSLACWRPDLPGLSSAPEGKFIDLSAGRFHTCAINRLGAVMCWGNDGCGASSPPPRQFVQLSAGDEHTCGLTVDGVAECWGNNEYGQASAPPDEFVHVSAGGDHSCGLKADGTVLCWGENFFGEADAPSNGKNNSSVVLNEDCVDENVIIQSDSDVASMMPITCILGSLTISAAQVDTVSLPMLEYIGQVLTVRSNSILTTLKFPALKRMSMLDVSENSGLSVDLSAIETAEEILIKGNDTVDIDLRALQSTTVVNMNSNTTTAQIRLDNLAAVATNLTVTDDSAIASLSLPELQRVGREVSMVNLSSVSVIDMDALRAAKSVSLVAHPLLTHVEMGRLELADAISMTNNDSLKSIDLSTLQSVGSLSIVGNPLLNQLNLSSLLTVEGSISIVENNILECDVDTLNTAVSGDGTALICENSPEAGCGPDSCPD